MLTVRKLHAKATAELPHRRFYKILTPSETGILLGPETAIVKGTMLHGQEHRALALLSAAHHRPVDPAILRAFEAAERLIQQGEPTTAMITLILSGFAPLPETEPERGDALWRLFAAAELLDSGIDPADLIRGWGYGEALAKFNPDQPRVPSGQSGGGQWMGGEDGGYGSGGGDRYLTNTVPADTSIADRQTPFQVSAWDQKRQECHDKCAPLTVGRNLSDSLAAYRRCVRDCLPPDYGF